MTFCFPSTLVLRSRRIYKSLAPIEVIPGIRESAYVLKIRLLASAEIVSIMFLCEALELENALEVHRGVSVL